MTIKKETRAILEMLLCAALWSIAGVLMKLLPWSGFALSSLRSLIAGITIAVYMLICRMRLHICRQTLLAGILTGLVYTCFTCANKLTTAANAIVLQFTSPVWIMLLSALLFHTKIRRMDAITVVLLLGGIALLFLDQLEGGHLTGNLVALLAGLLMAGMFIAVGTQGIEERFSSILIGQTVTFLLGLPVVIATKPVMNFTTVSAILALGIFQLGIAYILYVRASRYCPPLACCLLGGLEPLLNPVWVMLFDGETPGPLALVGCGVVIVTVTLWCILDGKAKERNA